MDYEIVFNDWREFVDKIANTEELLKKHTGYVYRGQKHDKRLNPSLYRDSTLSVPDWENHLENFKKAIRGRRGNNPEKLGKDFDFWAIGQHQGLKTPLLDWTKSIFVALFFAFSEKTEDNVNRVVFGLNRYDLEHKYEKILNSTIYFYEPDSNDNPRLLNQAGLFTYQEYSATKFSIEALIEDIFKNETNKILIKFKIKDTDRENCLRYLNKFNINYATLYPDLYGASMHVNLMTELRDY